MIFFKKKNGEKVEKSFTEKMVRHNRWIVALAFLDLVVMVIASYTCLEVMRESIMVKHFNKIFMVTTLLVVIAIGFTWSLRGWQRHDLYSVVTGMSVTQLRRFRGELDDEIDKLGTEISIDKNARPIVPKKKETA